jgi:DNA-directed RNA polymerase omega subunit
VENFDYIDSKFRLSLLAARRAKQLVGGSRKKVDILAENPLTIALEEIRRGKINFEILEDEEYSRLELEKEYASSPLIEEEADDSLEAENLFFGEPEESDSQEADSQEVDSQEEDSQEEAG